MYGGKLLKAAVGMAQRSLPLAVEAGEVVQGVIILLRTLSKLGVQFKGAFVIRRLYVSRRDEI